MRRQLCVPCGRLPHHDNQLPSRFTTLKRGGPENNFEVEAVTYCGGKLFGEDKGTPLPYKLLTFRQK